MFILKLGGSVITKKSEQGCFRPEVVDNLAREINKANTEVILVHGAGSFGHILAKQYELNKGYKNEDQLHGFSLTHAMVQTLNSFVLKSLHSHNVSAVSLSPHSIVKLNDHELARMNYKIFEEYLDKHFTPVTFGDVVLDEKLGFSICSGDLLVMTLAKYFKPEKVIFVMDEDGLYTSNPKINKDAEFIESMTIEKLEKLTTSIDAHADVTGGMGGKIDTMKNISRLGIDTVLLNGNKQDVLYNVLIGEDDKCTIVYGDKK